MVVKLSSDCVIFFSGSISDLKSSVSNGTMVNEIYTLLGTVQKKKQLIMNCDSIL